MSKQNKNGKRKATLEEMVKSDSQIVLQREDGTEQAIEEIIDNQASTQPIFRKIGAKLLQNREGVVHLGTKLCVYK